QPSSHGTAPTPKSHVVTPNESFRRCAKITSATWMRTMGPRCFCRLFPSQDDSYVAISAEPAEVIFAQRLSCGEHAKTRLLYKFSTNYQDAHRGRRPRSAGAQRRHGGCGQEQAGRGRGVRAVRAQWCCDPS